MKHYTEEERVALGYGPLVWVDIETTGLDPQNDSVLEVAMLITSNDLQGLYYAGSTLVIDPIRPKFDQMDSIVREMHVKSNLLDEHQAMIEGDPVAAFNCLANMVEDHFITQLDIAVSKAHQLGGELASTHPILLAGSSVHFDRAFLKRLMPTFLGRLSYRNLDVTTLLEASRRWDYMAASRMDEAKAASMLYSDQGAHRAMPDILSSLASALFYRDMKADVPWPKPNALTTLIFGTNHIIKDRSPW